MRSLPKQLARWNPLRETLLQQTSSDVLLLLFIYGYRKIGQDGYTNTAVTSERQVTVIQWTSVCYDSHESGCDGLAAWRIAAPFRGDKMVRRISRQFMCGVAKRLNRSLCHYERHWADGHVYVLSHRKCKSLSFFSSTINGLSSSCSHTTFFLLCEQSIRFRPSVVTSEHRCSLSKPSI